jgi:membrane protein
MKKYFGLIKDAGKDFMSDNAPRLGASVAFYTIFSLSPLFIIVIAIASLVFHEHAGDQIYKEISAAVGPKGAETVRAIMNQPATQKHGALASVIAIITLLLGSTGVFMELQAALNRIWEVEVKPGTGIWGFIRQRLLSFAMVLSVGFLLLVSLILTAAISAFGKYLSAAMPSLEAISQILNFVASFGVITLLMALIFKYMPDVRMPWREVWLGAAITSLLFVVGKLGLGMYLAKNTTANAFGAAGSLVLLLMWVYYSAQILFFGAEVTQAYVKMRGSKVVPVKHAKVKEAEDQRKAPATDAHPGESKEKARPAPMPRYAPAHAHTHAQAHGKAGFLVPGLVLLLAVFLPKSRSHSAGL